MVRSEPDCSESLDELVRRLQEAIAWCDPRADPDAPRTCLRTDDLRPRTLEPDYFAAVRHVLYWRSSALGRTAATADLRGASGRLLIYFPDAELSDGVAEQETAGYFDVYNAPPWDTWVGMFADPPPPRGSGYDKYLVAWVPQSFLDLAGAGIEVNPEQSIDWLGSTSVSLVTRLRHHPILGSLMFRP